MNDCKNHILEDAKKKQKAEHHYMVHLECFYVGHAWNFRYSREYFLHKCIPCNTFFKDSSCTRSKISMRMCNQYETILQSLFWIGAQIWCSYLDHETIFPHFSGSQQKINSICWIMTRFGWSKRWKRKEKYNLIGLKEKL